jgi:hypothetical protein
MWLFILKLLLTAVAILGLLVIPLGIPGTVVIFGAITIYAFATGLQSISGWELLLLFLLCITAEGGDNILSMLLAKRYGASRGSMVWSIVGAFVGGLFGANASGWLATLILAGTPVGVLSLLVSALLTMLFAIAGAFIAVLICEIRSGRTIDEAIRIARATVVGRVLGTILRLAIAFLMFAILMKSMFGSP